MAKGIAISIAAETKPFLQGVQKGIIEPLEDAADILQDLGQDGGRDFDKLEKSMRDAQDETDDTKRAFADLQREIAETGKKSRTDFANPVKKSTHEVNENLDEVGREAKANAAEMFSSFDGSFESIADAAQGTLGGLTAGLSGIGPMAAVAAGAAGIGLISAAVIGQIEAAEELKTALTDAYRTAAEEGRSFLDEAQILAVALDITSDTDKRVAAMKEAAAIGVDSTTFIRALAGDADALAFASAAADEKLKEVRDSQGANNSTLATAIAKTEDYAGTARKLADLAKQHGLNKDGAEAYIDFVDDSNQRERAQIGRTLDAEAARFDGLAAKYDEAAARPSVEVRFEPTLPSDEIIRQRLQAAARRQSIQIPLSAVTRNGTVVF